MLRVIHVPPEPSLVLTDLARCLVIMYYILSCSYADSDFGIHSWSTRVHVLVVDESPMFNEELSLLVTRHVFTSLLDISFAQDGCEVHRGMFVYSSCSSQGSLSSSSSMR